MTPAKQELAALGFPWPANFARGFLRTELLKRGSAGADLDALLGHRDAGGGAIGLHSTFDFRRSNERLAAGLDDLHNALGLKFMPSPLVPSHRDEPDKDVLLAPMHRAGPVGRGRSGQPRQQSRVAGLTAFWTQLHQRATDDDRAQVALFVRLLRVAARNGNPLAQLLCADNPFEHGALRLSALLDEDSSNSLVESSLRTSELAKEAIHHRICDLELAKGARDLVLSLKELAERTTRARFTLAASWFRLLVRAQRMLRQQQIYIPDLPLVNIVRPPSSPFAEDSVLILPIVDGWRKAVHNWSTKALGEARAWHDAAKPLSARRSEPVLTGGAGQPIVRFTFPEPPSVFSAEGWAAALMLSATINGMLLDIAALSMLLRRFCTPGQRDLPLSGPHRRAHLDFRVPGSGSVDRQTQRWWLDPVSELIWLYAPPMPRQLRLGDLHPWLRRISLLALPGSVAVPLEPRSFSDLIRCAEVWWLARASRTVVAGQRRHIDASSVLTARWGQLMGGYRLAPPPLHKTVGKVPLDVRVESGQGRKEAALGEPRAPRKRRSRPESSEYEQLALVEFDGDRSIDRDADSGSVGRQDAELLAAVDAAHPWLRTVSDALREISSAPAELRAGELHKLLPTDCGALAATLVEFADWLADPEGGAFSGPPLVRAFNAAAQAILLASDDIVGPSDPPDATALARLIGEADDLPLAAGASLRSVRQALMRLAEFLDLSDPVLGRLDASDRVELLNDSEAQSHADACILSHEEYQDIMLSLEADHHSGLSTGDRALSRLLMMLCFRLGLRPGEVYGLRLRDVGKAHIYVLPYGSHTLKSGNARRRIPLDALMDADERARLADFVQARLNRGAHPDDLLLAQPNHGPAERQRLDRIVHRVMRRVTLDPWVRLYHARHSLSTWCDLALRAEENPEVFRFFEHLPKTSAFLRRGGELAVSLFGSKDAALGRGSFALARLVGHIGPAITHMHYTHLDDLVRAAAVEREAATLPVTDWMDLAGLPRSSAYALLSDRRGFFALIDSARRRVGWRVTAMNVRSDSPALALEARSAPRALAVASEATGEDAWIPFSRIIDISTAVAEGKRSASQLAGMYGLDVGRVESMLAGLKRWLPEVAQPGERATRDASAGRVGLTLSAEMDLYLRQAETKLRSRAGHDPVKLADEIEFLVRTYDRRDRDFHVRDSKALERLTGVLVDIGVRPEAAELVVRSIDPEGLVGQLPECATAEALGEFAACPIRYIGVRVASKAGSYAKWIGITPVTEAQEGCASTFALAGVLCLALLDGISSAPK